jgi:class 3 adenylate cyclase
MIRAERKARLRVPREALWRLVADTDRLNRELGLPPVRFQFRPREEGGSFLRGTARIAGQTFHYDEEPYCWVRPEGWFVRRHVDNGPVAMYSPGVTLRPAGEKGDETDVVAWCEVLPRSPLGRVIAKRVAESSAGALLRACQVFESYLTEAAATPYPRHRAIPPAERERVTVGVTRLQTAGVAANLAERFGNLLIEAPIEDVTNFRPYYLAERWGVGRRTLLELCLSAVRVGLLEMRWRLLCPACRGIGETVAHLAELKAGAAHCESCNIRYGPEFDRSVEVVFTVAPTIRRTETGEATYCVGGPANSPHVLLQWYLPAHGTQELSPTLPPGIYRLSSPQAAAPQELRLEARSTETETASLLAVPDDGRIRFAVPPLVPAVGKWHLENRSAIPVLLRFETPGWVTEAATAAEVTLLQAFRDSFSSEVLSPGAEMAVQQIALLFSDLKGSTAMYAERGDAPSYALVRDHFDFFREIIAAEGGAILKTMGDAVMAAFSDPAPAIRAALTAQRRAPNELRGLCVKIGVHAGPALAVNSNGALDYFGQVVNRAARVQAQSVGGDVVILESLTADPRVSALLTDKTAALSVEPFRAHLRGDADNVPLLRIWVQDSTG